MNKLRNQQKHQNALEYQKVADKLFNQYQRQLQLMRMKRAKSEKAATARN
jgi:ABC-type Fe3+-hydroxamate transport system substrate-binding protein